MNLYLFLAVDNTVLSAGKIGKEVSIRTNDIFTRANDIFVIANDILTRANDIFVIANDILARANDILVWANDIFGKNHLFGTNLRANYLITD